MKKWLFALGAVALLAEPVSALPVRVSHEEAVVGVQPIQVVTRAGVAHHSTRRVARPRVRR